MKNIQVGQMRVWHIPQIPLENGQEPFFVYVKDLEEAKLIINTLCLYDLYQYENKIKPDYSNAPGLEVYDGEGVWCEWENDEGDTIECII